MTLRDRCKLLLQQMQQDAILRQGSPVDTLLAFVIAETGRKAEPDLNESLPVCLYFKSDSDREEFIEAVRLAKPGMKTRKVP